MRTIMVMLLATMAACTGESEQASALSARATLVGNSPSWATATNFKAAAAATDWVNIRVYLGWQNPEGARALAAAVSDPSSSSYGQYLTPQQFRQQFAPSAQAGQTGQHGLS